MWTSAVICAVTVRNNRSRKSSSDYRLSGISLCVSKFSKAGVAGGWGGVEGGACGPHHVGFPRLGAPVEAVDADAHVALAAQGARHHLPQPCAQGGAACVGGTLPPGGRGTARRAGSPSRRRQRLDSPSRPVDGSGG